jgi:hypothetical protein
VPTLADRMQDALLRHGQMSAAELALIVCAPTAKVREFLEHDPRFRVGQIEGRLETPGYSVAEAA